MPGRKRKPVKKAIWNRPISGKVVSDTLTWLVRTCIPVIAWAVWVQIQSNARLEQGQAVQQAQLTALDRKVDTHTTQLQRVWEALGRKNDARQP